MFWQRAARCEYSCAVMRGLQTTELGDIRSTYDTIVIGAGPAGCATAACFAARGASVLLIESNPKAARRFAGEWIHPEGARVLNAYGLLEGLESSVEGRGFVVFPNDGLGPIRLDYPGLATGLACEHETLVTHLRRRVAELSHVDYVEGVRGRLAGPDAVELSAGGGKTHRVHSRRVVVAAGRSSRGVAEATREDQVSSSPTRSCRSTDTDTSSWEDRVRSSPIASTSVGFASASTCQTRSVAARMLRNGFGSRLRRYCQRLSVRASARVSLALRFRGRPTRFDPDAIKPGQALRSSAMRRAFFIR